MKRIITALLITMALSACSTTVHIHNQRADGGFTEVEVTKTFLK